MTHKILITLSYIINIIVFSLYGTQSPNILILSNQSKLMGGGLSYEMSLYYELINQGINTTIIHVNNKPLHHFFKKNNIPGNCCTFEDLKSKLFNVCKEKKISVIHTSSRKELLSAKAIKKYFPLKIVATLHMQTFDTTQLQLLSGVDGIITVNQNVVCKLEEIRKNSIYTLGKIIHIPVFFDEKSFQNIHLQGNAAEFFYQNWHITIDPTFPIITSIAHFYPNKNHKNHAVLIKAVNHLINECKKQVYLIFAGAGPEKEAMETLVNQLKLNQYIHFLGNVSKQSIPELLAHSTIKALTSSSEGTGIVLLEAAMLKKPLIGTRGTGMEQVIKDGQTGLLFENDNYLDLAEKLKYLLDNPLYAKELGINAYEYVTKNISNEINVKKYLSFIATL